MQIVRTLNSVYHIDGNKVMLESGTPSKHLPFGEWVEVLRVSEPRIGESVFIFYPDDKMRITSPIVSIE